MRGRPLVPAVFANKRVLLELALMLGASLCVFAVSFYFDLHERFDVFLNSYERWEVDEFLLLGLCLTVALSILSWRRHRELQRELAHRKVLEHQLEHRATHDPLTDLPNRGLLMDRVTHAIDRTTRSETCVVMLFLDLDGFKEVNDTLGHEAGDRVLIMVAERLRSLTRTSDTVSRLGGDEFAVMLEDVEDPSQARTLAGRILDILEEPLQVDGREVRISASIGITLGAHPHYSAEELLHLADTAMYRAKKAGKARYEVLYP